MFETLVESGDRRTPPSRAGAMALAVHVVAVAFAVQQTRSSPPVKPAPVPIEIFLPIDEPDPTPPADATTSSDDPGLPTADPSPVISTDAIDPGPISFDSQRPADPGPDIRQTLMNDARRSVFSLNSGAPGRLAPDSILLVGEVDDPVRVLQPASPRYPRAQEAAGVPGRVTLQFVVDTMGAVESRSVRVIAATDSAFAQPSREAINATRFIPANAKGRKVRQLVRQTIEFTVR